MHGAELGEFLGRHGLAARNARDIGHGAIHFLNAVVG
jgi:hypothetical protein